MRNDRETGEPNAADCSGFGTCYATPLRIRNGECIDERCYWRNTLPFMGDTDELSLTGTLITIATHGKDTDVFKYHNSVVGTRSPMRIEISIMMMMRMTTSSQSITVAPRQLSALYGRKDCNGVSCDQTQIAVLRRAMTICFSVEALRVVSDEHFVCSLKDWRLQNGWNSKQIGQFGMNQRGKRLPARGQATLLLPSLPNIFTPKLRVCPLSNVA